MNSTSRPAENTRPLHEHPGLPRYCPAQIETINRVWSAAATGHRPSGGLSLRPTRLQNKRRWLALTLGSDEVYCRFHPETEPPEWAGFQDRLPEDFLVDAQIARHAETLARLEQLARASLEDAAVRPLPSDETLVAVEARIAGPSSVRLTLVARPKFIQVLVEHGTGWPETRPLPRSALHALPVEVPVLLPGRPVTLEQLRDIEPGDVLLLGRRREATSRATLAGPIHTFSLHLADGKAEIIEHHLQPASNSQEVSFMAEKPDPADLQAQQDAPTEPEDSPPPETRGTEAQTAESTDQPAAEARTETSTARPLDQVALDVTFEVGRLSLSVGELVELRPGYTFSLPVPIEGNNVNIRIQGQLMGRGQLVAVGDHLGIRIQSWEDDGNRID